MTFSCQDPKKEKADENTAEKTSPSIITQDNFPQVMTKMRFGCGGQTNNISIVGGNTTGKFNVLMRHYGPSKQISNNEEGYDTSELIVKESMMT